MTPEIETAPAPSPPPAPARRPTWRQALRLLRDNPRATLLPMAAFQIPLVAAVAVSYFYLYHEAYPDADFEAFNRPNELPGGLALSLTVMSAVYLFLTYVAFGATVVAVRNVLDGRPVKLVESLDPAFTRMGGLLVLWAIMAVMAIGIAAFVVVLLYPMIRWATAIHAFLLDEKGVAGALGSSWRATRSNMLRFVGLTLTAIPLALAIFTAGAIVIAVAVAPFSADPGRTASLVIQSLSAILLGIVAIPTGAYLGAVTTIFYLSVKEQPRV